MYITIIQQDAAARSQFYFTAALLYTFRLLSTPIIRSTLTVSTASGTAHTSVEEGSCTDVLPVPETVDTVNILLMMGVESSRNV